MLIKAPMAKLSRISTMLMMGKAATKMKSRERNGGWNSKLMRDDPKAWSRITGRIGPKRGSSTLNTDFISFGTPLSPCTCTFLTRYRLIFITCTITPYSLAFQDTYTRELYFFDIAMNLVFGIDLVLNFFSAYYDADMVIIDDYKVIIIPTLLRWF